MPDFPRPDPAIGVFETLLVLGGEPVELDAHVQRLGASVRELYAVALPPHAEALVLEHAAALPVGRLRLTAAPGPGGVPELDVVTAAVDRENVFPGWERAIALSPFVVEGGLGAHKWADREGLASREAAEPGGALPLLMDVGEELLEASRANVFAVDGECLLTPPVDGRILPGVARARAIECARSLGIEVREEPLSTGRLLDCGEAFLTGSVRGIEPVSSIGGARLSPTGETAAALAAELQRQWTGGRAARSTQTS
jgi:para-aminobenzoate synthetase / 4-amino-4-deoxychorismate lyase